MNSPARLQDGSPFTVDRLTSPEVVRNPYPFYDLLRDQAPLFGYRDYPPGTIPGVDRPEPAWVVLSYEDVARVAYDHETFSSRDSIQEQSGAPSLMLVNHDRPEHNRLRKIAARAFLPSSIRLLSDEVRDIVDRSLDEFIDLPSADGQAVDVMREYCALLPARVIALLTGVPESRDRDIRRWATAFMLSADLSPQERNLCNEEIMAFFTDHVTRQSAAIDRGEHPPGQLLNAFLQTEVDGERLTLEEVIRFCMTITVAGAETTSFLLGNLMAVFADFPLVWETFRQDPASFNAIYEETLRYHGPPQRLFRVATRDVQIRHATIRRGDWVACFFGAANFDPVAFPDPYSFRLDRKNGNRHMSFGHGIHRCLGAPLAKLEAELTALVLRERYAALTRGSRSIVWQDVSLLNHGPHENPIIFRENNAGGAPPGKG